MKKIILVLLIIVLIISAVMLLKKRQQAVADLPLPTPLTIQVKVVSATTGSLEQTRPFLAQLTAKEIAAISSKLSGRIKEVLVKENQTVKEGDLLLQIDDLEIVAAIKSQRITLAAQKKEVQYAKTIRERNQSLFEAGGLALEEFEASEVSFTTKQAAFEATRQKIVELEVQLSYLNIKAPFDGIVGTIVSRKGNLATPGKSLLSINSLDRKLIFNYMPGEIDIQTGQEVFLQGEKTGQIINLYSDAVNGLSVAEVNVETALALPNNSYVTIDVVTFSGSGCRVPVNALIMTKAGATLMLYQDEKFASFPVTVIANNKEYALVEPCPTVPVALGSAAKLSELPGHGKVLISRSDAHEKQ